LGGLRPPRKYVHPVGVRREPHRRLMSFWEGCALPASLPRQGRGASQVSTLSCAHLFAGDAGDAALLALSEAGA